MGHFSGLLTLLAVLCCLNRVTGEVYYITINSSDVCTVQPCLTFSQFAANLSRYLHSDNTTLVFLPGTHHLSNVNLTLSNVKSFMMKSENSTAQIKCTNDSSMHFSQLQCIHITDLEFTGCGGNQVIQVKEFLVTDTTFEGQENSGTALELSGTTAQIVNCTFVSNRKGSYRESVKVYVDGSGLTFKNGFVGGAIIATNSTTVTISQSKFEDNKAESIGGAIFADNYSTINITDNVSFIDNFADVTGGVLYSSTGVIAIISSCTLSNNKATNILYTITSTLTIEASEFHNNAASGLGVLYLVDSSVTIEASEFSANKGGVLYLHSCSITIKASEFYNNVAILYSVLYPYNSSVTIEASEFHDNNASTSSLLYSIGSNITIEGSVFYRNRALSMRGVLTSQQHSTVTVGNCNFTDNTSPRGAVIFAEGSNKIQYHNHLLIDRNLGSAPIYLSGSEFRGNDSGNFIFSNNHGSLVAVNSNVTFSGYTKFVNNQPNATTGTVQEGGAITLLQSNVFFDGECSFEHNHAENGGAIHSTESKFYVNGDVTIAHNTATGNGGGVYLESTSELNCQRDSIFVLYNNTAVSKGGGLHAISSSIKASFYRPSLVLGYNNYYSDSYISTKMNIVKNKAKFGGGLALEANAKLNILKYCYSNYTTNTTMFTGNSAEYGGAVYVNDDTNSGTCASYPKTECFFQVLALYDQSSISGSIILKCMYFSENTANISGATLYGGLLDRCTISLFAEVYQKYAPVDIERNNPRDGGIAYFKNVSTIIADVSISSDPVRVCFCTNISSSMHDCTDQDRKLNKEVKKGEAFTVSLIAVDQVGQPVCATIQASLSSAESGLGEGQLSKNISTNCTDFTFNVVSPHGSETLALYASDGPCRNVELSRATVKINFHPCTCLIGLQVVEMQITNCTCECHSDISRYMERCDSHNGSLVKNNSRAWISYINDTSLSGYLVYPNCPFDYCLSTSLQFNLNDQPNGADAQCAFNRSSLLCGSCQSGLSLSLGSSRCLLCPDYWPALFIAITIAAILAGIALVTLLLLLNMTVAVGTLNGLIFYANVVYAYQSILLPFEETNLITVFISWLNLDLGIDACYFPGMDTYIKTWLQLAFPAYVIFLVVSIIIISYYSTKFSNLIGKKDPVATLATLILLSNAKLVEVCFKSLTVGILQYPYGSNETLRVWLPDATVKYLSGKHIPLFITAIFILLLCLVYTALLFSWQWLLHLPKWRIFKWSRNPKIQTFIETYHLPYTPKHRYWTGLLLIARIVLYLVAAVNVSNDPIIALTAITFVVCCIVLLKAFIINLRYRKWSIEVLETFFCLNVLFFTIFSSYALGKERIHQEAIAYTSVTITIVVLLLIILCHVYTYTSLFSKIKRTMLGRKIDRLFTDTDPKPKPRLRRYSPPPDDDDSHRFHDRDLLDELDSGDYDDTPPLHGPSSVEPTFSVVELPQHPEGANPLGISADSAECGDKI